MQQLPMQQLPMQQGQQQETKLLQATRLVLPLPRVVTTLQGSQAAVEQQQADQQQVKARAQAAVLQAMDGEQQPANKSTTLNNTDKEGRGISVS
jgi:hypothetical protein